MPPQEPPPPATLLSLPEPVLVRILSLLDDDAERLVALGLPAAGLPVHRPPARCA